jgi:hypothetical protein
MKKHQRKKTKLNRETLRQLENGSLQQVAAGSSPSECDTVCCTRHPCTTG